jgi:hypothetical protein
MPLHSRTFESPYLVDTLFTTERDCQRCRVGSARGRQPKKEAEMLRAIHLKTAALTSEWAAAFAEMTVARVSGVAKVITVRSLGIVSVMFDDSSTTPEKIVLALQSAGVDARILRGRS